MQRREVSGKFTKWPPVSENPAFGAIYVPPCKHPAPHVETALEANTKTAHERDIRVAELEFLAHMEKHGPNVTVYPDFPERFSLDPGAFKDLVYALICDGCLTGQEPDSHHVGMAAGFPADPRNNLWAASSGVIHRVLNLAFPYELRLFHGGRLRLARLRQELDGARALDSTGILFDGRYLERDLRVRLAMAHRGTLITLLMGDLDHFKQVNDRLGHGEGDEVLRRYFSVFRDMATGIGDVYRRSGDEVVGVLSGLDEQESKALAEAICRAVQAELAYLCDLKVTVSLGVLVADQGDPRALLKEVDRRLYLAKNAGRNRVSAG
jgi:diguanylate cyclase (GGDEF)-like protein